MEIKKKHSQTLVEAQKIINSNYTGVVSLFNIIADNFEKRRSGFHRLVFLLLRVIEVEKVIMFMVLPKLHLTAYLSGLRNRLYDAQVHVLTVKPGFVATKMTEELDLPEKLTAQPEEVASDIYKAQQQW